MKTQRLGIPYELAEVKDYATLTLDGKLVFEFDTTTNPQWICVNCYIDGEYTVESGAMFWMDYMEDVFDTIKSIDEYSCRYMMAATCLLGQLTFE